MKKRVAGSVPPYSRPRSKSKSPPTTPKKRKTTERKKATKTKDRLAKSLTHLKTKTISVGTIRIKSSDLKPYVRGKSSWRASGQKFPEAMRVVHLFKAHGKFDFLIDKVNAGFLKGQLSPSGRVQGARINILPNGKKLDKAFSLFAKNLVIHDESSDAHWDVIYQNPNGDYAYVYTLDKDAKSRNKKYAKVKDFEKKYPGLRKAVLLALRNRNDDMAVPMFTLLNTFMRIGNEIYYKEHGHKGLTTLKKGDVTIHGKDVTFSFLAKDGVPMKITESFPRVYVVRLRTLLRPLKRTNFIFTSGAGTPIEEEKFRVAFKKYCGEEFYPHIVRSYYATSEAERFLREHRRAAVEDDEKKILFMKIADKLGHRKFDKKSHAWKDSYTVTIHHYIRPDLVEKIEKL